MAKIANPPRPREKLFLGAQLRQIRAAHGISQAVFADRLGLSPSYVNQLEHDQRPVSASVLMRLSQMFDVDIGALSSDELDQTATELRTALAEPAYEEPGLEPRLIRHLAGAAPELARAFLKSHRLNKRYEERLQALDSRFDLGAPAEELDTRPAPLPYDEVRDYFHEQNNYIDRLDRAAEELSISQNFYGADIYDRLAVYLEKVHGLTVTACLPERSTETIYDYDRKTRQVTLNSALSERTLSFQLAALIGLIEQESEIEALLDGAGFRTDQARDICKLALANYYAGALIFPYRPFAEKAREVRHDIEQLQHFFGASFEQVCHRLSNMQRSGEAGIPFFFVRVDRAGNITKRHSATKLQFTRFGGACPLWNAHEAFTVPGRIFVQIAETPDGTRYLSIARSIVKRAGRYDGYDRHFAVGLGCELKHAGDVVYGDGLDFTAPGAITPIGVNCRICERTNCPQRAFPPVGRPIVTDTSRRRFVPYSVT